MTDDMNEQKERRRAQWRSASARYYQRKKEQTGIDRLINEISKKYAESGGARACTGKNKGILDRILDFFS
jgi:hypothetical protein